jgi:BA14K-like protein
MEVAMTSPSSFLAAAIIAASASLTGLAAAAPMQARLKPDAALVETVQFRGGNWGSNHPLMTGEGWNAQMRAWDAREGRQWGGANASVDCRRFRSYDRRSGTYRGRDGRRHRCS